MATKLQIIADSNSTYVDNSTGNITPTTVKALNTDWINSTVFAEQTSSMSVATASFAILASTASFVAGNVASASVATTASFALTASSTPNAIVTGSVSSNILTFTKGNGTSFNLTVAQSGSVVSSSYSDFSNQANSASLASNSLLLQGTGSNGFVTTGSFATTSGSLSSRVSSLEAATSSLSASIATVNSRVTVVSSSLLVTSASLLQVSASYIALSASYNVFSGSASTRITTNSASIASLNTATASFAVLAANQTFSGVNTFNNAVTMSNVKVTGTASIAFLDVTFQSSSVIYSSGSNQFGDASNDTQTLWGTVNVISGPLVVTGSANFKETITGSISGNAATANSSTSASYAYTASSAVNASAALTAISSSYAYTASSAENATSASFATSASYALNAGSIFPFSGSAVITGSLEVTGSFSIASGSILLLANTALNNRGLSAMVTQSAASRNNIIAVTFGSTSSTGSFVISGSSNYISLASPVANANFNQGAAFGANLTNSILTVLPLITGSNGSANARPLPTISNSSVNARITINDRRAIQSTSAPLTMATSAILSTFSLSSNTGSYNIDSLITNALSTVIDHTGSVVDANGVGGMYGTAIFGNAHNIKQVLSSSADLLYSLISGQRNRLLISGSGPDNNLNAVGVIGNFLIITGSSGGGGSDSGTLLVGRYNNPIGNLGDSLQTVVAVGTGASEATRRTSLHVSSSGLTTIFNGLVVSGSQNISGSLYGSPVSQSVSSLTASLNLQAGNFFNLTLPASVNTYITASGQLPGQTINLKITQQATTGSISLGAGIKQVSGSAYTVTAVASAVDIVTFISFDNTGLYLSNVKNLV